MNCARRSSGLWAAPEHPLSWLVLRWRTPSWTCHRPCPAAMWSRSATASEPGRRPAAPMRREPPMPADVHTRQLRYFLAVAESGSFRHAARQLYVTQPALSRSIKQLEASLGVRLFERSTRGTELTGAGFAIVEPAKRL